MGSYSSLIGAFLSERTIGRQTRKVPMLAINGKVEDDHAIKRSMGEVVLSTKGEGSEKPRSGCPDLWLSLGKLQL